MPKLTCKDHKPCACTKSGKSCCYCDFEGTRPCVREKSDLFEAIEANNTVDDRARRQALRCPFCKPNRGENAKRRPKHGKTKPKAKEKRR